MGFHLPGIRRSSFSAKLTSAKSGEVPKGYLAVYIGGEMKRFVIPISYLNQPSFQELLSEAEKNSVLIIQWVPSLFLAQKMPF